MRRCAFIATLLIGCGSPGTDINTLDNTQTDGAAGQGTNPPPTAYTDPFAGAPAYANPGRGGGGGSHNAGQACGQPRCHGGSGEGPAFLIGGTVYQDYKGTVAAAGVEVRITDLAGHSANTYSESNGNFYIRSSSSNGVTFPAVVGARDGTNTRPMITTLTSAAMGSCGQTSCHVPPGPSYYPIHVP